jgi:hypothetical protein
VASTAAIADFFGLAAPASRPAAAAAAAPVAEPQAEPRAEPEVESGRPAQPGWLDRIIAVGRDGIAQVVPSAPKAWLRKPSAAETPRQPEAAPEPPPGGGRVDPGQVIRRALRAAGLLDR